MGSGGTSCWGGSRSRSHASRSSGCGRARGRRVAQPEAGHVEGVEQDRLLRVAHVVGLEAEAAGDEKTQRLATSILKEEQRMLDRVLNEIPRLTDAVARAEMGRLEGQLSAARNRKLLRVRG